MKNLVDYINEDLLKSYDVQDYKKTIDEITDIFKSYIDKGQIKFARCIENNKYRFNGNRKSIECIFDDLYKLQTKKRRVLSYFKLDIYIDLVKTKDRDNNGIYITDWEDYKEIQVVLAIDDEKIQKYFNDVFVELCK